MLKKEELLAQEVKSSNIRNFSIVAHIDHGKSTLANYFLERLINKGKNSPETVIFSKALCRFDLEAQKGVTFKLNYVRLPYYSFFLKDFFVFNLIDTPGHIDFKYEVILSLIVCEGVILLVDATKGVQAQTLFYYNIAKTLHLKVLPVINKTDLPYSQVQLVQKQLVNLLHCSAEDILLISAKTGYNIDKLFEKIVSFFPSPTFRNDIQI